MNQTPRELPRKSECQVIDLQRELTGKAAEHLLPPAPLSLHLESSGHPGLLVVAEWTEHTPSPGRVAPSSLTDCKLARVGSRGGQILANISHAGQSRWGSVFCLVL